MVDYGPVNDVTRAVLPPGTYVVGDPCYAIDSADWLDWLLEGGLDDNVSVMCAPYGDGWAVGVSTAHGDGEYADRDGNVYGVDSGMIGLVPVDAARNGGDANVVTFGSDVTAAIDGTKIRLGHIEIETDPWDGTNAY